MSPEDFIRMVGPHAVKVQEDTGIAAASIIAQAALETGWGKTMVKAGFNLFGIKATGKEPSVTLVTHEESPDGYKQRIEARFRRYDSWKSSLLDYVNFIFSNPRYKLARTVRHNPEAYVLALQVCGYATDSKYGEKIIKVMHGRNLIERFPPPDPKKIANLSR